jgi:signal transduction histidine kinase
VHFDEVSLQETDSAVSQQPILNYLRSRFETKPPDLLVPIGARAVKFATANRSKLFPFTPMLLTAVDDRHLENFDLTSNETIVAVRNDPSLVIETILSLLPDTKSVFVVIGNSEVERFWRQSLEGEFLQFRNKLTFEWGNELTFSEMLKRSSTLPPHSAIFYALMSVDREGIAQTEGTALEELHEVANAPIFGVQSSQFGHGIVGGSLMSMEDLGQTAARVTARILKGESPGSIKTDPLVPGPPLFDWRELRRWNIDESRLPSDSIIKFREPTLWQRYKWYVVASIAVFSIELVLIVGLISNLVRRRKAEAAARELGKQLVRAEEAERTRIARELHDDITQRLARLAIDAGGLNSDQQATRSAVARDVREELTRLSEDGHALAYKMHPALLQRLGLATSLRVECERFSQRESIPVCLNLAEIPRQVSQDTALCLVRVMQEALTNVGRHAQAETAAVSLRVAGEGLELTVTDTGIGFKPGMEFRQSLGLASMQERVRLLEGQLTVESKPNKGTMVRAWVPLDENRITT